VTPLTLAIFSAARFGLFLSFLYIGFDERNDLLSSESCRQESVKVSPCEAHAGSASAMSA
jgi:hypothetical protein